MSVKEAAKEKVHKVADFLNIRKQAEGWKEFTRDLPSTNWIRFIGSVLIVTTAITLYTAILMEKEIDHILFGEWLIFLAALEGIAYKQFAKKRDTFINGATTREDIAERERPQ